MGKISPFSLFPPAQQSGWRFVMKKNLLIVVSFFSFFSACVDMQAAKRVDWDTTGGDVLTDGGGEDVWGEDTADEMSWEVKFITRGENSSIPPPKKRREWVVIEPACVPASCVDDNSCTDDACDPTTGCVFTPNTQLCDDGNACTAGDTCDDGTCAGTVVECGDGNACTDDICDPAVGCTHKALSGCGEEVAVDLCKQVNCDDGDICTIDGCDPATGCTTQPADCDDGNVCTVDTCNNADGCFHAPANCDDGDLCTADACDPAVGCTYEPGACDDGNLYTDDACDPTTGCMHTPIEIPCESMIGVEFTGLQLWGVKNFSIQNGVQSEAFPIAANPCCKEGHAVDIYIVPPFEKLEAVGYLLPEGNNCKDFFKCRHICGFFEGKNWLPMIQYTPPKDCACRNDVSAWGPEGPVYSAPP
ncbi:MAG: hypothetical protein UV20_C0025G0002 [Candidatus Magasanikbacteria bacterium GW2011_GWA2_42_32]|uniref:Uncharacterized protein n=1 Tax=Candidatus Magasanikbacteria bacterium GW2011_GWA2_42_32 TaxID=1619039 RepID=A0A0G1A3F8_9BACT|nr:MAG: hypothetical protein UV20_C0025G0002 [Candidatus Magasanikbacteria bacterium GW2011_GWA2_42_32]